MTTNQPAEYAVSKIRSATKFLSSLRNFSTWLKSAPGMTDIDGAVERKGHVMFMEFKPWQEGVFISYGQATLYKVLSWIPNFTVLLIGEVSETRNDDDILYWTNFSNLPKASYSNFGTKGYWWKAEQFTASTKVELDGKVKLWFDYANANPVDWKKYLNDKQTCKECESRAVRPNLVWTEHVDS